MKKLLITTSLILSMTAREVCAKGVTKPMPSKLKGFYVGAGIGSTTLKTSMKIDSLNGGVSDNTSARIDNTSPSFHGILGYERKIKNDYILGIEGSYMYSNVRADTRNCLKDYLSASQEGVNSLSLNHTYGLSLIAGKEFGRLVPYLKLGAVLSEFEVKADFSALTVKGSERKKVFGMSAGVGARYAINQRLDVITEVGSAFYPSFRSRNFDEDAGDRHTVKIDPWFFMFMIGLRWKF